MSFFYLTVSANGNVYKWSDLDIVIATGNFKNERRDKT